MHKRAGKTIRALSDLTPDRRNANAHTERGVGMLEQICAWRFLFRGGGCE